MKIRRSFTESLFEDLVTDEDKFDTWYDDDEPMTEDVETMNEKLTLKDVASILDVNRQVLTTLNDETIADFAVGVVGKNVAKAWYSTHPETVLNRLQLDRQEELYYSIGYAYEAAKKLADKFERGEMFTTAEFKASVKQVVDSISTTVDSFRSHYTTFWANDIMQSIAKVYMQKYLAPELNEVMAAEKAAGKAAKKAEREQNKAMIVNAGVSADDAQAWLKENVVRIRYSFPVNNDETVFFPDTLDNGKKDENAAAKNAALDDEWKSILDTFLSNQPGAKEGIDYIKRLTSASNDTYKCLWRPTAAIWLKAPISSAPDSVKTALDAAKRKASLNGTSVKTVAGLGDATLIYSYYFANVVIDKVFNKDILEVNKNVKSKKQDSADELIGDEDDKSVEQAEKRLKSKVKSK